MAKRLNGSNEVEKLADLGSKPYKEQAIWFLNAFWTSFGQAQAEKIWSNVQLMAQLDTVNKAQGCAVDEFMAHHFLEKNNETLTVQKMREELRQVGIEKVKLVPLIHYLIFKHKADWKYMVNAPQGNQEEIAKAQRLLEEVQAAFEEARAREEEAINEEQEATRAANEAKRTAEEARRTAEASAKAAAQAKKTAEESQQAAEEAQRRADEARAAQEELEAALQALKEQEEAYQRKTEELQRKSEEGGLVSRNKAKNELAQHLGEDPLPLRRAKITTEAATKKAEKTATAAADASAAASAAAAAAADAAAAAEAAAEEAAAAAAAADRAADAAEKAAKKAAAARAAAEEAVQDAQKKVAEAEAYLEEVKNMPGGEGSVWWIERELHEAKAYMPASKGGYKKAK